MKILLVSLFALAVWVFVLEPPLPRVGHLPRGCHVAKTDTVRVVPHGFLLVGLNYFVHQSSVSYSGDDSFWICTKGNGQYRLYAPEKML